MISIAEKIKSNIHIEKELLDKVDSCIATGEYKSRNDFYIKAIENEIANTLLKNDILVDKISKAIDKQTQNLAKRISGGMFKYAVDMSVIMHILAAGFDVSDEDIYRVRGKAIRDVQKTKGRISFEAIADFQNSDRPVERIEDDWHE